MGGPSCRSLGSSGARRVCCLACASLGLRGKRRTEGERFDASGPRGRGETETEERGGGRWDEATLRDSSAFYGEGEEVEAALSHVCIAGRRAWLAGSLNFSEFVCRFGYFPTVFLLVIVLFLYESDSFV
jgi:hypothetical protein